MLSRVLVLTVCLLVAACDASPPDQATPGVTFDTGDPTQQQAAVSEVPDDPDNWTVIYEPVGTGSTLSYQVVLAANPEQPATLLIKLGGLDGPLPGTQVYVRAIDPTAAPEEPKWQPIEPEGLYLEQYDGGHLRGEPGESTLDIYNGLGGFARYETTLPPATKSGQYELRLFTPHFVDDQYAKRLADRVFQLEPSPTASGDDPASINAG